MDFALQYGFRLGTLEVYPLRGEIVGPNGTVHLQPKAMEVLVCLAERPMDVVDCLRTLVAMAMAYHYDYGQNRMQGLQCGLRICLYLIERCSIPCALALGVHNWEAQKYGPTTERCVIMSGRSTGE